MAKIELDDVSKVYGEGVQAVDDISLTVEDGELLVLVGPSGSGKSTTLRMIAGLEDVTDGEIRIDGEVVNEVQPQNRDIAMVFQSFALYPHRSVRENMSFPLEARGRVQDEIDRTIEETAEVLGISELLDRKPTELSGGQQQRVALGRAIVRDPRAFLLDEPLASLDAKLRKEMRAEVGRLQNDLDATMVHVTHNQEEAMTLGDRIAVMNNGEIQQLAPPEVAYTEPTNRFVAGFIGEPSMNFIVGRIEGDRFVSGDDSIELTLSPQFASADLDGDLTLGIRPEHVSIAEEPGDHTITGSAVVTELLGDAKVVHVDIGGNEYMAKVSPDYDVEAGETVHLHLDPAEHHLFDGVGETAERVTPPDATAPEA